MSDAAPLKIAILWHMHQPDYREPGSSRLRMPWVRLHALKDYLDMPLRAAAHDGVRVTFNLVPSLLDQLELYQRGGEDRHLELSRRPAADLDDDEKREILDTFFIGHRVTMIDVHPRFKELREKFDRSSDRPQILAALFTSEEMRDLQVWSNLAWIDPMFRAEEPVRSLFEKQRHFTEDEKLALLDWQTRLIARIVPTYRDLYHQGAIDVSFTPYYHPILPLLCDTGVAREALPGIHLPARRFTHPEDADHQIAAAISKFEAIFDKPPVGMWPSEGSVSEEAVSIMGRRGIRWTASDEAVLRHSLARSSLNPIDHPVHAVYEYDGVRMLFRDHGLSDRIGFVYSAWPAERAVGDFLEHLHQLRQNLSHRLEASVVPIILDGENAWEYYPSDGAHFLDDLYDALSRDPLLETVTMTAAADMPATPLSSLFPGSWINHNFRIWIGHDEDNTAWDLLSRARDALVAFQSANKDFDSNRLAQAWEQIYRAEGSDWCWWYGDDHRGQYNEQFDQIYRRHLAAVYQLIGQQVPAELGRPIHQSGVGSFTIPPDDIMTAQIDGRISHFYEWAGAGFYDCLKAGGAMHRIARYVAGIHFGYDHNQFYIRLDFHDRKGLDLFDDPVIELACFTPVPRVIKLRPKAEGYGADNPGEYQYAMAAICEVALNRKFLWPDGSGKLNLNVRLADGDHTMEEWPEQATIDIEVPEPNREIFWPT